MAYFYIVNVMYKNNILWSVYSVIFSLCLTSVVYKQKFKYLRFKSQIKIFPISWITELPTNPLLEFKTKFSVSQLFFMSILKLNFDEMYISVKNITILIIFSKFKKILIVDTWNIIYSVHIFYSVVTINYNCFIVIINIILIIVKISDF